MIASSIYLAGIIPIMGRFMVAVTKAMIGKHGHGMRVIENVLLILI